MRTGAFLAVVLAGCSFVGVRAPARTREPPADPSSIHCTESGVLPAIDALGGAAAISVMGGGILLEGAKGEPKHFTLYYAGPLLALAIGYFWSTSVGNTRTARCSDLKQAASNAQPVVLPIEPGPKKSRPEIEIDTSP